MHIWQIKCQGGLEGKTQRRKVASPVNGFPRGERTRARLASWDNFSSLQSMAEDPKLCDSWFGVITAGYRQDERRSWEVRVDWFAYLEGEVVI